MGNSNNRPAKPFDPDDVDFEIDAFEINLHALERECVIQPQLMRYWSIQVAEFRAEVERAKHRRDRVIGQMLQKIYKDPNKYRVVKVTEKSIEAALHTLDRYHEAQEEVVKAQYNYDRAKANVDALHHRKGSLENAVQLQLSGYYAEPKVPEKYREKVKEHRTEEVRKRGQIKS